MGMRKNDVNLHCSRESLALEHDPLPPSSKHQVLYFVPPFDPSSHAKEIEQQLPWLPRISGLPWLKGSSYRPGSTDPQLVEQWRFWAFKNGAWTWLNNENPWILNNFHNHFQGFHGFPKVNDYDKKWNRYE